MLLDLIIPKTCKYCGSAEVLSIDICLSCILSEFILEDIPECRILIKERMHVRWAVAGYRLGEGAIRSLIYKFKYAGKKKLAFKLGVEIAQRWKPPDLSFYLVPIPIHQKRKFKRGYNQTEIIARGMASIWNVDVVADALRRTSHTKSLTSAGRWQRADELKGVLEVGSQSLNGAVVLVDDVLTTGATLRACRDVLENANIEVIGAAVIALA